MLVVFCDGAPGALVFVLLHRFATGSAREVTFLELTSPKLPDRPGAVDEVRLGIAAADVHLEVATTCPSGDVLQAILGFLASTAASDERCDALRRNAEEIYAIGSDDVFLADQEATFLFVAPACELCEVGGASNGLLEHVHMSRF